MKYPLGSHYLKKGILGLSLSLGLSSCLGITNQDGAEVGSPTAFGISVSGSSGGEAYGRTLFPLVRAQCGSCHGMSQAPKFAVSDAARSYKVIKTQGLVNFNSPTFSRLTIKRTDAHCGAQCVGNGNDFVQAIRAWSKAESGSSGGGGGGTPPPTPVGILPPILTADILIPADLPTGSGTAAAEFRRLTISLESIRAEWANINLSFEIQVYRGSNAYRVRNMRFIFPTGNTRKIYYRSIMPVVNGKVERNATTYQIAEGVEPSSFDTNVIRNVSSSSLLVLQDKGKGQDRILFGFEELDPSTGDCSQLASWTTNVKPALIANCTNCHNTITTFRIDAAATDAVNCARTMQRVSFSNPTQSNLIMIPKFGQARRDGSLHPVQNSLNDAVVTNWMKWINAEVAGQ